MARQTLSFIDKLPRWLGCCARGRGSRTILYAVVLCGGWAASVASTVADELDELRKAWQSENAEKIVQLRDQVTATDEHSMFQADYLMATAQCSSSDRSRQLAGMALLRQLPDTFRALEYAEIGVVFLAFQKCRGIINGMIRINRSVSRNETWIDLASIGDDINQADTVSTSGNGNMPRQNRRTKRPKLPVDVRRNGDDNLSDKLRDDNRSVKPEGSVFVQPDVTLAGTGGGDAGMGKDRNNLTFVEEAHGTDSGKEALRRIGQEVQIRGLDEVLIELDQSLIPRIKDSTHELRSVEREPPGGLAAPGVRKPGFGMTLGPDKFPKNKLTTPSINRDLDIGPELAPPPKIAIEIDVPVLNQKELIKPQKIKSSIPRQIAPKIEPKRDLQIRR